MEESPGPSDHSSTGAARDRRTKNIVPWPGVPSAVSVSSCSLMMLWLIDNPSPVPLPHLFCREERVKEVGVTSAGMPGPESCTASSTLATPPHATNRQVLLRDGFRRVLGVAKQIDQHPLQLNDIARDDPLAEPDQEGAPASQQSGDWQPGGVLDWKPEGRLPGEHWQSAHRTPAIAQHDLFIILRND